MYDKLGEKQPLSFRKLIPVFGDISQKSLNLSVADRQMLIERMTIIIHNAASVKFNDSLKYAILTNTRSVRDICILAENMKNLIVSNCKLILCGYIFIKNSLYCFIMCYIIFHRGLIVY